MSTITTLPYNSLRPMPLSRIRISTDIRLHPDFMENPTGYARSRKIDLMSKPFPETSYKNDPNADGKQEREKVNIHLIQYEALRLFAELESDGWHVRCIDLKPSLLLYCTENCLLVEKDLLLSLSLLKVTVSQLLASPSDACHIVPGLADNANTHVAYWRAIECDALFRNIDLRSLHGISHPRTRAAEGMSKNRIMLGKENDPVVICLKKASWHENAKQPQRKINGLSVRMTLQDNAPLVIEASEYAVPIKGTKRLIKFRPSDIARVFEDHLSALQGDCLLIPPEWTGMGNAVTHAKALALLSVLTPIPLEELTAMDAEIRHPSKSTINRLKNDVAAAADCLRPIPVSALFQPLNDARREWERMTPRKSYIDPQIAAIYAPDTTSH